MSTRDDPIRADDSSPSGPPVDPWRLGRYLAGDLEGPERDAVRRLVTTVPAWAEACHAARLLAVQLDPLVEVSWEALDALEEPDAEQFERLLDRLFSEPAGPTLSAATEAGLAIIATEPDRLWGSFQVFEAARERGMDFSPAEVDRALEQAAERGFLEEMVDEGQAAAVVARLDASDPPSGYRLALPRIEIVARLCRARSADPNAHDVLDWLERTAATFGLDAERRKAARRWLERRLGRRSEDP